MFQTISSVTKKKITLFITRPILSKCRITFKKKLNLYLEILSVNVYFMLLFFDFVKIFLKMILLFKVDPTHSFASKLL